jgi:serine/threonine protein kinase KIN1/2
MKNIHSMGFVHADLKPANLLLHREEANSLQYVKICDFGVSQIMLKTEKGYEKALMKDRSGTAGYMAPEIKTNNTLVGPEIDVWAFGVILYEMAVAYKPTQVRRYQYSQGPIPFVARDWKHLENKGADIQDLIIKCLNMNPEERITVDQALAHSWLSPPIIDINKQEQI